MKNKNLVAISGKLGSGKDTVGKIVQILTTFPKMSTERVVEHLHKDLANSEYKIKKFADKLKDIVCILIGCTREQLEGREFKEIELGEEWWYYTNTLFYGENKKLIPYLEADEVIHSSTGWYLIKLTPRLLLQLLGTECGRQIIHPNIWVNSLMREYKKEYLNTPTFSDFSNTRLYSMPKWIITDLRFENEFKAVEDRGGITIGVERDVELRIPDLWEDYQNSPGEYDNWYVYLKEHGMFETVYHESETALENFEFDYPIYNDGSIEELVEQVKSILIKEQII